MTTSPERDSSVVIGATNPLRACPLAACLALAACENAGEQRVLGIEATGGCGVWRIYPLAVTCGRRWTMGWAW